MFLHASSNVGESRDFAFPGVFLERGSCIYYCVTKQANLACTLTMPMYTYRVYRKTEQLNYHLTGPQLLHHLADGFVVDERACCRFCCPSLSTVPFRLLPHTACALRKVYETSKLGSAACALRNEAPICFYLKHTVQINTWCPGLECVGRKRFMESVNGRRTGSVLVLQRVGACVCVCVCSGC